MEYFLFILRIVLAGIFFLAGIGKLLDLKGAEKAVKDFGVPESLAKPFSIILPLAEIGFAILLLFVETSWFGAIGASLLLLIFIGGMLWQMKQGNAPDCHCFGQIHSEPVSPKSLFRNAIFAVLALVLVVSGQDHQGLPLTHLANNSNEVMQIVFGLIIIGLFVIGLFLLKNILDKQTQILRRLEVLEIIAGDGNSVERENIGSPVEGLPIGSPLPNFMMPKLNGGVITNKQILARGKPILFFNVSPTCTPCQAILPDIEKWEKELADKITFVFISTGSVKENKEKFASDSERITLIQENRELAELLDIRWTPTVLFVNKKGIIASHPAAGDSAIRELIEDLKSKNLADEMVFVPKEQANGKMPKIGENVPEFSLEDITGNQITANYFQGKKTLVAFWSLTCPHCVEMLDALSEWDKVKGLDEPELVIFSDGDLEEHKKIKLDSPIILDKDYETSEKFGMLGTPSAVLVDETGKFVSETATGAGKIWALVGRK